MAGYQYLPNAPQTMEQLNRANVQSQRSNVQLNQTLQYLLGAPASGLPKDVVATFAPHVDELVKLVPSEVLNPPPLVFGAPVFGREGYMPSATGDINLAEKSQQSALGQMQKRHKQYMQKFFSQPGGALANVGGDLAGSVGVLEELLGTNVEPGAYRDLMLSKWRSITPDSLGTEWMEQLEFSAEPEIRRLTDQRTYPGGPAPQAVREDLQQQFARLGLV